MSAFDFTGKHVFVSAGISGIGLGKAHVLLAL